MLDAIAKLMPVVTIAGGAAASSPQIKAQIEKIANTTKIVVTQQEVNDIGTMVYLELVSEDGKKVEPAQFADWLRQNMRTKGGQKRDTSFDSWGTPYGLAYDERAHRVYVISAGPDKQYNTDDDIFASYAY